MDAAVAAEMLAETATVARVGERAASRLVELRSMFGADLTYVERELARSAKDGLSPATDSATHLLAAGGKRVRPLCVLLACACFGPISDGARELATAAEIVHIATLLHDDVVDDSDTRRGAIASRKVWGNAVSVLAGDLLLTHALDRTAHVASGATLTELLATLRKLVDGEVLQLRGRTGLASDAPLRSTLLESVYFAIVEGKTASLFSWAARAGARAGGASEAHVKALGDFGHAVGVAFQLVDDALDYAGDPSATGKKLLGDLREGKATLPLIVAIEKNPPLARTLLRASEGDERACAELFAAVVESRGSEIARARSESFTRDAQAALATIPESPARALLGALAVELTTRAT